MKLTQEALDIFMQLLNVLDTKQSIQFNRTHFVQGSFSRLAEPRYYNGEQYDCYQLIFSNGGNNGSEKQMRFMVSRDDNGFNPQTTVVVPYFLKVEVGGTIGGTIYLDNFHIGGIYGLIADLGIVFANDLLKEIYFRYLR